MRQRYSASAKKHIDSRGRSTLTQNYFSLIFYKNNKKYIKSNPIFRSSYVYINYKKFVTFYIIRILFQKQKHPKHDQRYLSITDVLVQLQPQPSLAVILDLNRDTVELCRQLYKLRCEGIDPLICYP